MRELATSKIPAFCKIMMMLHFYMLLKKSCVARYIIWTTTLANLFVCDRLLTRTVWIADTQGRETGCVTR